MVLTLALCLHQLEMVVILLLDLHYRLLVVEQVQDILEMEILLQMVLVEVVLALWQVLVEQELPMEIMAALVIQEDYDVEVVVVDLVERELVVHLVLMVV
jgi:hypothetical protein